MSARTARRQIQPRHVSSPFIEPKLLSLTRTAYAGSVLKRCRVRLSVRPSVCHDTTRYDSGAILSNSTRKLLWFEITKMLIAVKNNKFITSFIIIFGTLSFPIGPILLSRTGLRVPTCYRSDQVSSCTLHGPAVKRSICSGRRFVGGSLALPLQHSFKPKVKQQATSAEG